MKYLYILIFLLLMSPKIFGTDSSLEVKCPENAIVTINGAKQNITGKHRKYTFDFPSGEQGIVKLNIKSGQNTLCDKEIVVTGGLNTVFECEKPKVNFSLFSTSVQESIKPTPIKKEELAKKEEIVQDKIQNTENCSNGTCSTGFT